MRRLSALALAVCLFAAPVFGGDVNTPGKTEPPPPPPACTENCTTGTTATTTDISTMDYLTTALLELALAIIRP